MFQRSRLGGCADTVKVLHLHPFSLCKPKGKIALNDFATRHLQSSFIDKIRPIALLFLFALTAVLIPSYAAAQSGAGLQGTVSDAKGAALTKAVVVIKSTSTGKVTTAITDGQGHFTVGLPEGSYTVTASAPGFAVLTKPGGVAVGQSNTLDFSLAIGSATSDVTVEADATGSVAAALAPMDALLDATSARTEINAAMIQNFMSPVADYGEAVEMAPGTFTINGNGVGLGQSKTTFRGFPDGFYDIKFDGIPWSDTNSVSHHSWAFFPTQFIGSIDFDRSPGTASTIGFAPFGGSINLLSKEMSPVQNIRATFSGGSFNTYLYDLAYDSGPFGPGNKLNSSMDVHHMQSHGYQTGNNQTQNAGDIKVVYALSPKTTITGYSGVIWLDANTPNFKATRCQMYGVSTTSAYSCALANTPSGLAPYTGAGVNFLLTNNTDPLLYLDDQYNFYHVPTDFEYVGVHSELGKGFVLDFKPYTYNYDNSEKYANAVPITDNAALIGTTYAPLGVKITNNTLCSTVVATTKKGNTVYAEPCSVDKYNSYRQYGETSELSQFSRFGILHAGMWYNWGNTNRHQYPTDPLNHYLDQKLPNFKEKFVQDSYQPYAEYQFHLGKKLTVTPGVKFSYFTIGTQQFADNGSTIGCLAANCTYASTNPNQFISNGGSYFATLPSGVANYHIKSAWTAYVQYAEGTIAPPSNVFDFQQGFSGTAIAPAVLPKQQRNRTIQTGTTFKLKRVTFDADYYHIHFDNSYSSTINPVNGEPTYFAQPASITQGIEGESNLYLTHGFSLYLNASYDTATYTGSIAAACASTVSAAACTAAGALNVSAPSGLNVQETPSDIETEGLTYQHNAYDIGFFNKRVGTYYEDNGAYHNQLTIAPFTLANAFVNYTVHSNGYFNNTKFRLSLNNVFNSHYITNVSLKGTANTINIAANGITYTDPFNTLGQTPINGGDNITALPARSIMLTATFGYNPRGRK
jgi:iron complex outermembrane receptor protein